MSREFCIYCHTTPNGKKYIGQTCQNPRTRWRNGEGYQKSVYFYNAIKKYGWDNIKHVVLCWCSSKESADFLERWFIKKYKTNDSVHGYNLTDGGGGGLGREPSDRQRKWMSEYSRGLVWTDERRKKVSDTLKHKYSNGEIVRRPLTDEERRRRSDARKGELNPRYGTHISEETRAKMSRSHKGKVLSKEHRDKLSKAHLNSFKKKRCPVYQFTLDGKYLRSYTSMKEAERETGILAASISCCCRGKSRTSGGYIWCLQSKPETFPGPVEGFLAN